METSAERIARLERELAAARAERDQPDAAPPADQALPTSEALLRSMIESLPFDFFAVGPDGRYILQNASCREHGGDVIGMLPAEAAPDAATRAVWLENNRRAFTGETVTGEVQLPVEGELRHYYNVVHPIREGEEIRGILGVNVDITALKQSERERQELTEQLRLAQKMEAMGQLAAGVAHDFNNVLAAITAYAGLILARLHVEDPLSTRIVEIERAAFRGAELTRKLLAFSRKQVATPRVLDLNAVIRSTRTMLDRILGDDIELTCELADDLWPVKVDLSQLDQVLINLVINARDAMPDGGRLTIGTGNLTVREGPQDLSAPAGDYVRLWVADTGLGIDEHTRQRIFEPFFTTKEEGKGTGLGLSTVYGIVQQNGGSVTVESAPGRGAEFSVLLPRTAEAPTNVAALPSPVPAGGQETVLLVDDNDSLREVTREILALSGYRVLAAAGPTEAERLFVAHREDVRLLLTDVVMPRGTGPALASRLRSGSPELRVMYMSARPAVDLTTDPADGDHRESYLPKPFSVGELTRRVRQALDAS